MSPLVYFIYQDYANQPYAKITMTNACIWCKLNSRNEKVRKVLSNPSEHIYCWFCDRHIKVLCAGGTLALVLKDIVSRGASLEYIKVVAIVIAPPAADLLSKNFPSRLLCSSWSLPNAFDPVLPCILLELLDTMWARDCMKWVLALHTSQSLSFKALAVSYEKIVPDTYDWRWKEKQGLECRWHYARIDFSQINLCRYQSLYSHDRWELEWARLHCTWTRRCRGSCIWHLRSQH